MNFEWDENKRKQTLRERELDTDSIEISTRTEDENRIVKISKFDDCKIYVLVFTYRGDRIRIISFRRASKKFEEIYEKK